MAAHRSNFALRSAHKTGNNRRRAAAPVMFSNSRRTFGKDWTRGNRGPVIQSCIQNSITKLPQRETSMAETVVTLRLNQQQLELMDRTIAQGVASDRVSLVRLALREYAAARKAEAAR